MTDLNEATKPTIADVARMYEMQLELARLKAAEAMLRRRIFEHFFPNPTEGSKDNKYELNDGTGAILQADHKINRTVLEPELDALRAAVKEEGSNLPKLPFNKLVKYKPELVKAEYNKLTAEERQVFDRALKVEPGMPEVKVVIPKRGS
jgi:hypothetical protein